MSKKRISLPIIPPQIIRRMNDIEETVNQIYRKIDYIEQTIRYHENEDGCEHED